MPKGMECDELKLTPGSLSVARDNSKADRRKGMVATVTAVDPQRGGLTVAMDDGITQALDLADRHFRQGWVQNIHTSQGATATRVLAHMESFRINTVDARSLYVAVSRARDKAVLYTDSRVGLNEAIGLRSGSQIAALDQDRAWDFSAAIGG